MACERSIAVEPLASAFVTLETPAGGCVTESSHDSEGYMELIRPEIDRDAAAVRRVHLTAFPTAAEADLVERLRAAGKAVIELVATDADSIVGHILFSPLALRPRAGTVGLGLGPLAVMPDHEHHGVGRRLIQNGLAECHRWGAGFVVVIGDPPYYTRFGFEPAGKYGLKSDYDAGDAFMVFKLESGALPPPGTLVKYAPEFSDISKYPATAPAVSRKARRPAPPPRG